jgi:xylan 1,4-beta-xylosidase
MIKNSFMRILLCVPLLIISLLLPAQSEKIDITVDLSKTKGPMKPIWAWFGYDEPNYTYMRDGKKLLSEIAALSPVPVYVRAHNLMCSGDGTPALKWGSTGMYSEDANGNPVYNWHIVDSIFDTYINLKMRPLAQIGFMPEALTTFKGQYKHNWKPGQKYDEVYTGWAYPPNNYQKWAELIFQWVRHCVDRYGKAEVESWYWELWNEPNIGYLQAENKLTTYCKMYDFASDAVKRALPTARMGGPHATGGAEKFLDGFINHCLTGVNEATGKTGAPLDFIAFHAKGSPKIENGIVRMGIRSQLTNISEGLKVVASHTETKNLPVIIGESDPEGCAACGMYTNPENAYRNGTLYSSYTAASVSRIYDINEARGTNLIGAVNWSFEFENQPWFHGFRDLATNGVDKPVLNVFRMLGMMTGDRVEVSGNFAYDYQSMLAGGVRGDKTDINAIASKGKNSVAVMVWNYHDDNIVDDGSPVSVTLKNVLQGKVTLTHYRIDSNHSNSYEVWKKMGSPQNPTAEQISELEASGKLAMLSKPQKLKVKNNQLKIEMQLPRQAVSLLLISY